MAGRLNVNIRDISGNPVADTVVYLIPDIANESDIERPDKFEVDQKNKEFHPFVSVVPAGTTIYFPNRDGIGHHVYSFSPAKKFELPLSEAEITVPIVFDTEGVVTIGCNIHDWMAAYIYVVNSPYYDTTGKNGSVTFDELPADTYSLNIWHPGMTQSDAMEQTISIGSEPEVQHEIAIKLRPQYLWKPEQPPENEEEIY